MSGRFFFFITKTKIDQSTLQFTVPVHVVDLPEHLLLGLWSATQFGPAVVPTHSLRRFSDFSTSGKSWWEAGGGEGGRGFLRLECFK